MKTSLSGTLNKWDTSLIGTLFSVPKPKMNLTKWNTFLFETSSVDVFVTFHGKSGVLSEVRDNNTNDPDNEEESAKECEGEEEKEEITLSKALEMADKLIMYCPQKEIPDAHLQVPSIRNC